MQMVDCNLYHENHNEQTNSEFVEDKTSATSWPWAQVFFIISIILFVGAHSASRDFLNSFQWRWQRLRIQLHWSLDFRAGGHCEMAKMSGKKTKLSSGFVERELLNVKWSLTTLIERQDLRDFFLLARSVQIKLVCLERLWGRSKSVRLVEMIGNKTRRNVRHRQLAQIK